MYRAKSLGVLAATAILLLSLLPVSLPGNDLTALCNGCREEILQPGVQREISPEVTDDELKGLVDGNTAFALELYHKLVEGQDQDQDENIFLSPYSISFALAMAYAGARGNTASQMAEVLHFTLPEERLHPAFDALDLAITSRTETEGIELDTANAFWGQLGWPFLQEYIDLLSRNYGAEIRLLSFQSTPEACREHINSWVSEQTQGKIQDLLPPGSITPLTRLVLTNAIYFKGAWKYQFDPGLTEEEPFTLLDGSQVLIPMMALCPFLRGVIHCEEGVSLPYTEGRLAGTGVRYQALELPYRGEELSMVVLLPELAGFTEFEQALNAEQLRGILAGLHPTAVKVSLPRFSFTSGFSLRDQLSALGMPAAFGAGADFSGMDGRHDLWIDDVYHKAFIEVNEEGTEAAAATGATMVYGVPEVMEFRADHPFIFIIRNRETGAILFMGRVVNPAEWGEDEGAKGGA